jgi:hypothetical protein
MMSNSTDSGSSKFVKMFSGRKKESEVWKHFNYDQQTRKSMCNVLDDKGRRCGMLIAGKNPTNLKSHLCHKHEKVYAILKEHEIKLKAGKATIGQNDTVTGKLIVTRLKLYY